MHIPDGYLSLQTSVPIIGAMLPVWSVAVKKMKRVFQVKQLPLLSLCAAFSFIIMMFNIPLGPSSVHAIGAVFIAILMGPWASCIAVSIALIIQALIFGDGGILAIGANCFNMAFIMPFAGYYIYKLVKGKTDIVSKRGMIAIFIGSYVGMNLAAFFTAVEFGIQPILFKSAMGVPLYGPFPLWISIPAMMTEHLLVAGPIEGIITVSAIAYIARFSPALVYGPQIATAQEEKVPFVKKYKALLIALLVMVILTPLGIIASGTAWGEWGTEQVKSMAGYVPSGFEKLSGLWGSIMPDYSIPGLEGSFFKSSLGYIVCGVIGVVLILGVMLLSNKLISGSGKRNNE